MPGLYRAASCGSKCGIPVSEFGSVRTAASAIGHEHSGGAQCRGGYEACDLEGSGDNLKFGTRLDNESCETRTLITWVNNG